LTWYKANNAMHSDAATVESTNSEAQRRSVVGIGSTGELTTAIARFAVRASPFALCDRGPNLLALFAGGRRHLGQGTGEIKRGRGHRRHGRWGMPRIRFDRRRPHVEVDPGPASVGIVRTVASAWPEPHGGWDSG